MKSHPHGITIPYDHPAGKTQQMRHAITVNGVKMRAEKSGGSPPAARIIYQGKKSAWVYTPEELTEEAERLIELANLQLSLFDG